MIGTYIKLAAAAAVAAAVIGAWMYVSGLQNEVEKLKLELVTCVAQGSVLSQKILDQNASIMTAKTEADKRAAVAAIKIAEAQEETKKAKKKAGGIFTAPPSTPGNSCKSALDLINGVRK